MNREIIIVAPSLDTRQNVSGISAVTNFIIGNNHEYEYIHFQQGKSDIDHGFYTRLKRICVAYNQWKQLLKDHPNDIIHFNFPLDTPSIIRDFFFIRYAYRKKRKIVVHIHGGLFLFKNERPAVIDFLLKKIFLNDITFIALSNLEKEKLVNSFGCKKVEVLPNCVNLEDAKNFERGNKDLDKLEILYLGRIEPNKGIDYILKACEVLKTEGEKYSVHLAGIDQMGGYKERFRNALGSRFVDEGVVSGKKKNEILRKCNVFLMPSFYEGLPMSLLECMSYGMVPVVTNVGSIGQYVRNGENGYIVKVKDVDSIVMALNEIQGNRESAFMMGQKAKQTIFEEFSPIKYIDKLNEIYSYIRLEN